MGIEPFLVSSSVVLIVAQRLARKICPNCKEEHKVSTLLFTRLDFLPKRSANSQAIEAQAALIATIRGIAEELHYMR